MKNNEDAAAYYRALDKAGKALGKGRLAIVPEGSLLGETGKRGVLALIKELLAAHYDPKEMDDLFSGAFMRILTGTKSADDGPMPLLYTY